MFLILLLILLPSIICSFDDLDRYCSETEITDSLHENHIIIQCSQNSICSHLFSQRIGNMNSTVFGYLTASATREFLKRKTTPLRELVCNQKTIAEMNDDMWLLTIMANRLKGQPICSSSETLEVDKEGVSSCVCNTGDNCGSVSNDLTIIYVIGSSVLLGLVIIIVLQLTLLYTNTIKHKKWSLLFVSKKNKKIKDAFGFRGRQNLGFQIIDQIRSCLKFEERRFLFVWIKKPNIDVLIVLSKF